MTVTKEHIAKGVVKFIEAELIPNTGDRNKKFVLAMAKDSLKENHDLIDDFLKNPMISSIVSEDDGKYDLSHFSSILKSILSEYESFTITIPKIPLFSPTEKTIKISADDVDKLMRYVVPPDPTAV